ncbi:hypothetical protein HDV01_000732 [Terramyces sp. JEL0728]|nr:hypothetical protein HDV01_000732 [Terramyces sp. JEL0728]
MKPDHHQKKVSRQWQKKHNQLPVEKKEIEINEQPAYEHDDDSDLENDRKLETLISQGESFAYSNTAHSFKFKDEQAAEISNSKVDEIYTQLFTLDLQKLKNIPLESFNFEKKMEYKEAKDIPFVLRVTVQPAEEIAVAEQPELGTAAAIPKQKQDINEWLDDILG